MVYNTLFAILFKGEHNPTAMLPTQLRLRRNEWSKDTLPGDKLYFLFSTTIFTWDLGGAVQGEGMNGTE